MQNIPVKSISNHGEIKATVTSNSTPITVATPIPIGPNDKLFVQNLGTNPLFVKRGAGASATSFSHVLAAGTADDDGKGGVLWIDDFTGSITFAGTTPRYMAWLQ